MESNELLAQIILTLFNTEEFDVRINTVLRLTGNHAGVSRSYLFIDSPDGRSTSNTHEWCNTGVKPQIRELQAIPYEMIPSWKKMLVEDGQIITENIAELPEDVRAMLEPQEIKSLIVYPLLIEERVRGFIGFDECARQREWSETDLTLLKTISGFLSSIYERKIYHSALAKSEENFKSFFNTIDDLMLIADTDGGILYSNRAVQRKLGYDAEEVAGMHILDLHPPDKREEAGEILEEMFEGKRSYCPLELMKKDGTLLPVETRVWFGVWDKKERIFGISKDLTQEQEALQKFTRLFENNPALMAISSVEDNRFLEVNEAFVRALGYTREELIGKTSAELSLFTNPEQQKRAAEMLRDTGRIREIELEVRCRNGNPLIGLFNGDIIESQGNKYFLTVMTDITEQKRLQEILDSQRLRLAHIIEASRQGTWEWNVQTGEVVFNEQWANIAGYSLEELQPTTIDTWIQLVHPDDLELSNRLLEAHFSGESEYYDCECRMRHKSGRHVWIHDRGKVIKRDQEGKPLLMFGTHTDITDKKELEEKIRNLSIRDPLTGVYNRRYLYERMQALIHEYSRHGNVFSVSMLDIDRFKQLNDNYGHLAGDYILKAFTTILSRNIRPYDILARYGGEEFIIVSLNSPAEKTKSQVARILETVRAEKFVYEQETLEFTFSAGIADIAEAGAALGTPEQLIELADKRLYRAKETGRNRVE